MTQMTELEAEGAIVGISTPPPVSPSGRRRRQVGIVLAVGWLGGIVFLAVAASWLPIADPTAIPIKSNPLRAPGFRFEDVLGTDDIGRSELSRIVYGARASLQIGLLSTLLGGVIGTAIGIMAGYFGRWTDWVVDIGTNSLLAFPPLLFLLAVVAVLQPTTSSLVAALAVLSVPLFVRVARANTLAIANRDFVVAARALGIRPARILTRDILPNVAVPIASYASIVAAHLIIAEASLSFIGLGITPPTPAWGSMMADGYADMAAHPHLVLLPAIAFFFTVFSLNYVGDWTRNRYSRGTS